MGRRWPAICAGPGVEVVEVDRPNRQERRRKGKTDMVDAIEAARAAQGRAPARGSQDPRREHGSHPGAGGGETLGEIHQDQEPSTRSAISASPPPKRSASACKASPSDGGPQAAAMRPRAGSDPVVYATKTALRALGRRVLALDAETASIDQLLTQLLEDGHEDLLSLYGVGID